MMRSNDAKPRRLKEDCRITEDIKVRHLPPSHELLEHYRSKLKKLDSDFESLSEVVKDCQAVCGNVSKLQQELLEKDSEVSQLQQAVSDLQVYIFQERHQVLSLYADNDRLKIKNAELLRRNEILFSISGVSEEELTLFVKQTSSGSIAVPRRNVKRRSNKSKHSGDAVAGDVESSDEVALLQLRVQALEAQITEQRQLHEDEITALRQDRELQRAERIAERQKQQQTTGELAVQLEAARQQICKLSSELVRTKKQHIGVEAAWLSERETLFKAAKEDCGHRHPSKNVVLPGGGTKGCGVVAVLREQLAERERLLATYQEQCVAMETQVTRLHQQAESSKALFKDKVQKMVSQVSYLRNKYAELDRRRILEAEGFRSDIRLMRTRLRELERGFTKMGAAHGAAPPKRSASEASSNACLTSAGLSTGLTSTAMDTMHRARQLQDELKKIRNKVSNLESELQLDNDKSSAEFL